MRYLLLLSLGLPASDAIGQQNPALTEMVNAEKSFAAYAESVGIGEAFMKFLDDSAIVFEKGQIANGKEVWGPRKTDGAELIWYPEFAEIASSGDFGYTTGPSLFRVQKGSAEPDYKGYFSSIWQKNNYGEWKVILDIGCPVTGQVYDENKVGYLNQLVPHREKYTAAGDVKEAEAAFLKVYVSGQGYKDFASESATYYRPHANIMRGRLVADTVNVVYENAGSAMARTADLGYAYGYVTAHNRKGSYLRVWKKEKQKWKIVLEVVNY